MEAEIDRWAVGNGRGIRSVRFAGTGGLRLQLLGPIEGEIAVRQGIHEGAVADSLKLSVVAISICILAGRSVRAQTTPESTPMSPDCRPWVMSGRSAACRRPK